MENGLQFRTLSVPLKHPLHQTITEKQTEMHWQCIDCSIAVSFVKSRVHNKEESV